MYPELIKDTDFLIQTANFFPFELQVCRSQNMILFFA